MCLEIITWATTMSCRKLNLITWDKQRERERTLFYEASGVDTGSFYIHTALRERERETERQRDRETETDRDRQRQRGRERKGDRERERMNE